MSRFIFSVTLRLLSLKTRHALTSKKEILFHLSVLQSITTAYVKVKAVRIM